MWFFRSKKNKSTINYFPKLNDLLESKYAKHKNFFPIATVHLGERGINIEIPLIYVFIDPYFAILPKGMNYDHLNFQLDSNGRITPLFGIDALTLSENYSEYLEKALKSYEIYKTQGEEDCLVDIENGPVWWQNDETPKNVDGSNMTFICQIDMYELVEDDCRMFVFLNKELSEMRLIYQRT